MNRTRHLALESLCAMLFVLLALFANPSHTSEPGILPDLRFHYRGKHHKTKEQLFAGINAYHASMGWSLITNLRPCPGFNYTNGVGHMWCWTDVDTGRDGGNADSTWECPVEAATPVTIILPHGPNVQYLVYCRTPETQPPPPEACEDTCVGNPIQVNSQIKIQRDYDIGLGSLRFERTYTSQTGEWRHNFSTTAWNLELNTLANLISNSSAGCFAGTVKVFVPKQRVCLPYISESTIGRTGGADLLVQRTDGRSVGISSASRRSIDAGTRETARLVTSGGNFDGLVVYDGRDTIEFFDKEGRLTRRSSLRGGGVLLTYLSPTGHKYPASAPNCAGVSVGLGVAGRPSCITDIVSGRQLQLAYDNESRLISATDPSGHSVAYAYNGATSSSSSAFTGFHALTSIIYADQAQRTYHYNEASLTNNTDLPHALTGITDETNTRYAYFGYSATRKAVSTSRPNGIDAYTLVPSTASVIDALGRQFNFGTRTITKTGSDGSIVSRVLLPTDWTIPSPNGGRVAATRHYDAQGNLTQRSDHKGITTRYEYDLTRNYEILRTEAYGTTKARWMHTAWHPEWRLPVKNAEPKRMTWSIYNGQPDPTNGNAITTCAPNDALLEGHPIAVLCKRVQQATTDNTGQSGFTATLVGSQRAWTYTYNANGQVLTANGPRTDVSDTTTYAYYTTDDAQVPQRYRKGDLRTVTNALGHTTAYKAYDANGQPLSIADANGAVTTLTYDLRYRLTSRTIGDEQTTFEYWPTGLLKKTTLPDGSYLHYTYDVAHRLTTIRDSEGSLIHYTLDALGNRTKEEVSDPTSALSRTSRQVFNVLNRVSEQIGAADTANVTTTFGYDNNGNQTSIVGPLGRDIIQLYDELNRLTRVTDPLNGVTQYGYDGLDQLISVTDPKNLVTAYVYNGLGDLERQTSPDTGVTTNTYDSGGNLKTSIDARNAVTTYTYDELNRVATASFAVGTATEQTITYSYDAGSNGTGRITGASDADHSLAWTYDEQGRVLTATQVVGSISKTASYSYLNGLRQSVTTPSGQRITYGYTNGKITSVSVNGTVLVSGVLHEPFGPVRQWTWGNGALSVRTFDQDGKIMQIDSAGLRTYSHDDAFRIIGITDASDASLSWAYGYDDLDRLTSASKTGTALGYEYDANGNRRTQTGSAVSTFTIAPSSNRLTSTSGALTRTYGYDNAGNTTGFGGITFAYNARGRMRNSTKSGVTTSYTYNALGQLIKKGSNTVYYYDEQGHVFGVYNGSGSLAEEIVWLGDIPLATLRPKANGGVEIYYIHSDHLNTPRLIVGSVNSGARWRWDFDPFGVGVPNNNPTGAGAFEFDLRFPGQIYVAETGLSYNYYRDGYDPATGRYTQSDPIGLLGGLNTYGYAYQNPVSIIDPLGLDGWYCQRPLGKSPGTKGPLILNHQYLCVTRADGTIECGSQTTDGNGISSPGRPTRPDEDYYDEKSCKKVDDEKDRCYEQCVLYNFKKPRPRYGIGPQGTDCQEWSDTVNVGCKLLCGKDGKPREGFFSGVK